MMKSVNILILAITLNLVSLSAFAGLIGFSFNGTVDTANDINAFGLNVGDTVTVNGTFDDILTGVGLETILFNRNSGNTLTIEAGLLTYDETNDLEYSGDFPALYFLEGLLSGVNYAGLIDASGGALPADFYGTTDGFIGEIITSGGNCSIVTNCGIMGTWNYSSFTTSPIIVPAPGVLLLLVIGLVVSTRMRRKYGSIRISQRN